MSELSADEQQAAQASEPQAQPAASGEEYVRYEDNPENFPQDEDYVPAELSAPEVDPEEARKDETTVLATDKFNEEGRVQ